MSPFRIAVNRFLLAAMIAGVGAGAVMLVMSVAYGYPLLFSLVFAFVTLSLAFIASVLIGCPLYYFQQRNNPNSVWWLPVYMAVGSLAGVIFQVMFFGNSPFEIGAYDQELAMFYAPIGLGASVFGWAAARWGGSFGGHEET